MAEKKTTGETTGALKPQEHGGALRHGGTNRGGPGRPKNSFRKLCRKNFDRHVGKLNKRLRDPELKDSDLIAALSMFARYASERAVPVPEILDALHAQAEIVRSFDRLSAEDAERLVAQLKTPWNRL